MSKIQKIKLTLQRMLMQFGEIETDKGVLEYAGEELGVGAEVFIDDIAAPDGDYETENRIIVVVDGVVTEIKEKEAPAPDPEPEPEPEEIAAEEEAPVEEAPVVPEEPSLEDALAEILRPLVEELNNVKADLETVKARLAEIEEKLLAEAAKPADEEFKELNKSQKSNFFRN